MPLDIPDLDKLRYGQIVPGLIEAIPIFDSKWTDYNESDPGITLLEMLSFVTETLAYRANRIPPETYRTFLYMLAGAYGDRIDELLDDPVLARLDPQYHAFLEYLRQVADEPEPNPGQMTRKAAIFMDAPYLAVTAEDFEKLALEANQIIPDGVPPVESARAIARDDTVTLFINEAQQGTRAHLTRDAGRQVWKRTQGRRHSQETGHYVRLYLEPRLLLGTALRIVAPEPYILNLRIRMALAPDIDFERLGQALSRRLYDILDRGPYNRGWPLEEPPPHALLERLVRSVQGVRSVTIRASGFAQNETIAHRQIPRGALFLSELILEVARDDR